VEESHALPLSHGPISLVLGTTSQNLPNTTARILKFPFYYLLSYGCYRHADTFFYYLGALTRQLDGHQHVNTTTPEAKTNKRPEIVVKQIATK
jgi:hypothetical protein